jgi:hypothetical protein
MRAMRERRIGGVRRTECEDRQENTGENNGFVHVVTFYKENYR